MYQLLSVAHWIAVRLGLIKMSAYLLALSVKKVHPDRPNRILVLNKPIFSGDVQALVDVPSDYCFVIAPRLWLSRYVKHRCSFFTKLTDATYWPLMEGTVAQAKLREDMTTVLRVLVGQLEIEAILSGNFVYVTQQELMLAAKKEGVPFFVIYKEGMVPIGRHHVAQRELYRTKRFNGTKIFVYNKSIHDMLLGANIPGVNSSKIIVTGIPRFDSIAWRSSGVKKVKTVIMFAYIPKNKSEYLVDDGDDKVAYESILVQFQKWFVIWAMNNDDCKLIVKTKRKSHEAIIRSSMLAEGLQLSAVPNISVTSNGDVHRLIEKADLVAGYSSTTLLESLLMGVPVIEPDMSSVGKAKMLNLIPTEMLNRGYYRISKEEELESLLEYDGIVEAPTREDVELYLEKIVYKHDRQASLRVLEEINRELSKHAAVGRQSS